MDTSMFIDYAERNNVERLHELLNAGENINLFAYDRSALHAACVSNAKEAAEYLIGKGINVNLQDNITRATPLHYCAVYDCFEIANMILKYGGLLSIADDYGNQPLWTAVFNVKGRDGRLPIVELYLMHGADKHYKNKAGRSPADFANQIKYLPLLNVFEKY